MITALALLATATFSAEEIAAKFVDSGVTKRMGGYAPRRVDLTATSTGVKKAPAGLVAPRYGKIDLAGKTFLVILDEPEGKPAKLFIDANGDGDLTNDAANWKPGDGRGPWYMGDAKVEVGNGQMGQIVTYRFDPKDPQRAQLKDTLLFYTDYGYELNFSLDGQPHIAVVSDPASTKGFGIDRDGNGKTSYNYEMVAVGKPFNFTGTTYVIQAVDGKLVLDKAAEPIAKTPMPPNLEIGKKALKFDATATDGTKISFPNTYKGKLVLLDFWATWCGPCIEELPNLKKAYAKYHDQGFEVLGVSFDRENMAEKLAEFTKTNEMPWRQIYEGKYWETSLGKLHDVAGIPFVLLVDGDTGEILADAKTLRGEQIMDTIGNALAKKKGS